MAMVARVWLAQRLQDLFDFSLCLQRVMRSIDGFVKTYCRHGSV
jgi:hypothetical protein